MLFKSYGVLGWVQKRVGDTYAQKQKYVGKLSVLQGAIGFLNNFLGVGMFIIALGMGSDAASFFQHHLLRLRFRRPLFYVHADLAQLVKQNKFGVILHVVMFE